MATLYCARCMTTFDHAEAACPNERCAAQQPDSGWASILGAGDLLDRHYMIERCLAIGSAGLTYLARDTNPDGTPTGPRLAVKVLYASRAAGPFLRRLSTEAQILQELSHDHIVQLRGFVHRAGMEPYLVTLFEEGGSLAEHVGRTGPLSPRVAAGVAHQVLLALDVAHQAGVVHRDLKPDNVLLSAEVSAEEVPHCRVGDFGIATIDHGVAVRQPEVPAFAGTPEYAAPEQFEGTDPGAATDVFAAGGLLVYLLTGKAPVTLTERTNLALVLQQLTSQLPPRLSRIGARGTEDELARLQPIVSQMMARQPSARWTVQEALHALGELAGAEPDPGPALADGPPLPPDVAPVPLDLSTDGPPRPPPSIVQESRAPAPHAPPVVELVTPAPAPAAQPTSPTHTAAVAPSPPATPVPSGSPAPVAGTAALENASDAPPPPTWAREEPAPAMPLAERLAHAGTAAAESRVVAVRAADAPDASDSPSPYVPPVPARQSATPSLEVPRPSAQMAPPREHESPRPRGGALLWIGGLVIVLAMLGAVGVLVWG